MPITLKAARINAGLTQSEVAKALSVSKNTIASYEAYKTIPDMQTGQKLADLYQRSVNDIIFFVN